MTEDDFLYSQGMHDKLWYYVSLKDMHVVPFGWTGPFLSKKSAIEHSLGQKDTQNYD